MRPASQAAAARSGSPEHLGRLAERGLHLAAADLGQITRAVKRRLKQIQYRPHVVDGCLAGTGLGFGMDDLENHGERPTRRPLDERATGSDQLAALVLAP
ncbi:hypothetical protein ACFY8K_37660 [Streptomyces misionensis]|uniref:hypothetical protein n=1 Tax=Streptomyces misionensis TaxID=67331 RepID=UPI0036B5FFF4